MPSQPLSSTKSIFIHLEDMMGNRDLMRLKDIILKMVLGNYSMLSSNFLCPIVHVFVLKKTRSSFLVEDSAQDSVHLLNKLML